MKRARLTSKRSQREVESETDISQATLSRIESGDRPAKMNEVLSLAWALGYTVAELTGHSPVSERLQCAARASNDASMDGMREELTHFLELDAFLDEQGVPASA